MSNKKVKIYCYKLAKPIAKSLMNNLKDKVGRVEYDMGFIKENLGNIYLITLEKMKKGNEITLSNDFKFSYGGSLNKKINYTPYSPVESNSSDSSFLVMPGKAFLEEVDPNNTSIETIILNSIVSMIFLEEKTVDVNIETIEEKPADILNEEPVVSQVTIEEQEPVVSTDPLDLVKEESLYYTDPKQFVQPLINIEVPEEEIPNITTSGTYSENPEEWFEETDLGYNENDYEEICNRVNELEVENFKLSNKINNTVEEIKNMSIWDILFWKWKSKLLDILNL